ncbi:MAG: hypothetical protein ACTHJM_13090 [Marmoricola sp.]
MSAEGWYRDPFEVHEDRWISQGKPTKLVRDQGVESYDEPPSEEIDVELVPADEPEPTDGEDLKRADENNQPPGYTRAALDVFDQTSHTW